MEAPTRVANGVVVMCVVVEFTPNMPEEVFVRGSKVMAYTLWACDTTAQDTVFCVPVALFGFAQLTVRQGEPSGEAPPMVIKPEWLPAPRGSNSTPSNALLRAPLMTAQIATPVLSAGEPQLKLPKLDGAPGS